MGMQELVIAGLVGLVGVFAVLLGLVMLVRGLSSARNATIALVGDRTSPADLDPDEDAATVKLSGTVEAVPDPVETVDGRDAALHHLKAVAKNWRNLLSKRRDVRWLLAEGARLRRAVVGGEDGSWAVTADPVDENRRWGGVQEDSSSGYGTALRRPDVASGEWTREERYTDDGEVPDELVGYLQERYDSDVDLDLSKRGLGLVVGEEVVAAGDTLRVVGKVEPQPATAAAEGTSQASASAAAGDGEATATDGGPTATGGAPDVAVNLTPGATVTGDSWRTLAWTEAKSAVKAPAGLLVTGMGLFAFAAMLDLLGVVSLGIY
jgi:hypothetical protein